MELPDDVLAIIKDFSKPVSRPGWRKLCKMTSFSYHSAILKQYNSQRYSRRKPQVIYNFVREYSRRPQDIYKYSFDDPYMDWNRQIIIVSLKRI